MTTEVSTRTDLISGRKTYSFSANPVPVITPMGPAPGELLVETEVSGRVTSVRAVLHPKGADVSAMADVLVRLATFKLEPAELQGLEGAQPTVTFVLRPDGISALKARVMNAPDLQKLLDDPVLSQGERYAVEDLLVGVG